MANLTRNESPRPQTRMGRSRGAPEAGVRTVTVPPPPPPTHDNRRVLSGPLCWLMGMGCDGTAIHASNRLVKPPGQTAWSNRLVKTRSSPAEGPARGLWGRGPGVG
jgi:hypothetical protein